MTTTARDKKIADLVAALAAKKTRTAGQQAILDIHATSERSKQDQKKFDVLVNHELARLRAISAAAKAKAVLKEPKSSESRKQRTYRLIKAGALFDLAGMGDWSRGELMGILLINASADESLRASWKTRGDAFLASKEAKKKSVA